MLPDARKRSFPKRERLLRRSEFTAVADNGRRATAGSFIVIRVPRSDGCTRIGITASKKVGCAVVRNRIKRLVREWYRLNKEMFMAGDYSIIARRSASQLDIAGVARDLRRALVQLHA